MASPTVAATSADADALLTVRYLWDQGLPACRIARVMKRHPSTIYRWLEQLDALTAAGPPADPADEWDAE